MPKEVRWARYFSRREELQDPGVTERAIPGRDYCYRRSVDDRCQRDAGRAFYTLAQLQASLQHPAVFPLSGAQVTLWRCRFAPQLLEGVRRMSCVKHIVGIRIQFNARKLPLPRLQNECWWKVNTMA